MAVVYGATAENIDLIHVKAKTKPSGVYTFRGVAYRVQEGRMTHYAYNGKILQPFGHFVTQAGTYENKWSDSAAKALKLI